MMRSTMPLFLVRVVRRCIPLVLLCALPALGAAEVRLSATAFHEEHAAALVSVVESAIRDGRTPGAVVLIGSRDRIIYRKAFGNRSVEPAVSAMTEDTIFDLASLTKVVATSTAVMQLVEKGKLRLDAPAAAYWPAFRKNGKADITIRHLLTHYSGLRADLGSTRGWSGYDAAMQKIIAEKPTAPPGSSYRYSDINFEALGEIVRRVSGQTLDTYCRQHIFSPLGMNDTGFRPAGALKARIAPTGRRAGAVLCGEVQDPSCHAMGGVAGHAGLFSTADDLALFARMMLNGGSLGTVRILKPESVEQMTIPRSPEGRPRLRGLGWDLEAPLVANRDALAPVGAYGHLGYTGTSLWIDPVTDRFVIILTNRLHPKDSGNVKALRADIKSVVANAAAPLTNDHILASRPLVAPYLKTAGTASGVRQGRVKTGIDVLSEDRFEPLKGLRVGLITNHTGVDASGGRTVDMLRQGGIAVKALFSPEHGFSGTEDAKVTSSMDTVSGLLVHSLYGEVRRPTDAMLEGLDALVFDIQDAGVRFYTYISTMGYAMEAAARKGIAFFVLDRPNPITASFVQGPVLDRGLTSFTAYFPLPVRHGMTVGELAELFNAELRIGARLQVIRMLGYQRTDWFDETGLQWINPSPNLRSLRGATLYPGVALVEGTNVSVGRGTDSPFEVLGAPWINAQKFTAALSGLKIPGVRFSPVSFTPKESRYKNRVCNGTRITVVNRQLLDAPYLGVAIMGELRRLYPKEFKIDATLGMVGSRRVIESIKQGRSPAVIAKEWQGPLNEFLELRAKYLLYR